MTQAGTGYLGRRAPQAAPAPDTRHLGSGLLAVGLTCAAAFVVLAVHVSSHGPNRIDRRVADLLMAPSGSAASSHIAHVVSAGGSPAFVVVAAVALALLVWTRRRDAVLVGWCLLAPGIAGLLELATKDMVGTRLSVWSAVWSPELAQAFPSGHATGAASIATLVVVLALTSALAPARRTVVVTVAVLYAVAVAASRVVVGYHVATDAVGGLLLGTAVTTLSGAVALRWSASLARRAA